MAPRAQNRVSVSSSSLKIQMSTAQRGSSGRARKRQKTLNAAELRAVQAEEAEREAERIEAMSRQQRREYDRLRRDIPDDFDGNDGGGYADDVLHGRTTANISHAGEDLSPEDVERSDGALYERLLQSHRQLFGKYVDTRTRRNRTQDRVDAFARQIPSMSDAYLQWSLESGDDGLAHRYEPPRTQWCKRDAKFLWWTCATHEELVLIAGDQYVSSGCVRQGWVPVAAYFPTVVVTIRALEVFRVMSLRCPRLGVQAFVRALCDIHGVSPRPWLSSQFSVAFDIYLAIRADVDGRVQVALGRSTPNWRLKNACPACLYKLEGEPALEIPILTTVDGNNSLSRYELREREEVCEDGSTAPGASKERPDNRTVPGDYYLSREEVNKWAKEGLEDLMKGFDPGPEHGDEEEEDGCSDRWQNMKEDVTARAWGMYDETGIFPALCRHGFILVVVDMVKSGELAKYPFAVTAHLLRVLGEMAVGCKMGKMCHCHPVLGKLAAENSLRMLVGAFHGHGHGRYCQMKNLTTYVSGVGLESLEGCESYFSKSNALASTTRHASRFHRQQAIVNYMKHTDAFDTYQNLSLVLCSKYRRALEIKSTYSTLRDAMRRLNIESRDEPLEETMEMEYYQKLVNLRDAEERVAAVCGVTVPFMPAQAEGGYAEAAKATRRIETQRRHALELREKALAAVHDLEIRLGVERALDHLEKLVVERMFELAKCHMSGTGYKLRKPLQARSKAIKAAIAKYNDTAEAMEPPMPTLDWEDVVECAFLADFDLLREAREDIRKEPWALPAGRAAMDQYFKLLRADEEIQRLNIEIRRLITYMGDENRSSFVKRDVCGRRGTSGLRIKSRLHREHTAGHQYLEGAAYAGGPDVQMRAASPLMRRADIDAPLLTDDDEEDEDDDEGDHLAAAFMNILRVSSDASADAEGI
ncbi:hypothetical protein B0H13DRAFT_2349438 [Mycena leptocephala]|nr:hypothetical protein B0H13DRAFT_2349438 [Mycena leptocephala]